MQRANVGLRGRMKENLKPGRDDRNDSSLLQVVLCGADETIQSEVADLK